MNFFLKTDSIGFSLNKWNGEKNTLRNKSDKHFFFFFCVCVCVCVSKDFEADVSASILMLHSVSNLGI